MNRFHKSNVSDGNRKRLDVIMQNNSDISENKGFPIGNKRKQNVSMFPYETFPVVSFKKHKYHINILYINKLSKRFPSFHFLFL